MLLDGVFLPLTTPFYPDGRVYLRKLEYNVERYSRTPAAGLALLSSGAEAEGLTDAEACEVLAFGIAAAAKEKVMLAGVGRESVRATLALIEAAAAVHYDAVLVQGPAFAAAAEMHAETAAYFGAIADHSPLPLILVSKVARELSLDLVADLAQHPQVLGLVDRAERVEAVSLRTASTHREVEVTTTFAAATRRMLAVHEGSGPLTFVSADALGHGGTAVASAPPAARIKTRMKRVGFQVLLGETEEMLAGWRAGAVGALPRLGPAAPQACCEVLQAWKDQDEPLAAEKQARLLAAAARMEGAAGAAWAKYGCDLNGYFGGRPRLPLIALNGEQRAELEKAMESLRN